VNLLTELDDFQTSCWAESTFQRLQKGVRGQALL
jgi:hypothetical protein